MEVAVSDVQAIRNLVHRQFASMTWAPGELPDLCSFKDDFLAEAMLYPAVRPVVARSVEAFGERMNVLARSSLHAFHERVTDTQVHVFGNEAVAIVACENTENEKDINRNVEMLLLVKDSDRWKIAAHAWDRKTATGPISSYLTINS